MDGEVGPERLLGPTLWAPANNGWSQAMASQSSDSKRKPRKSVCYSTNYDLKADYREIRRLDLKKRLGVLLYRRERMERELEAIKAALSTLEEQMKSNVAYEQLSICDKSPS